MDRSDAVCDIISSVQSANFIELVACYFDFTLEADIDACVHHAHEGEAVGVLGGANATDVAANLTVNANLALGVNTPSAINGTAPRPPKKAKGSKPPKGSTRNGEFPSGSG